MSSFGVLLLSFVTRSMGQAACDPNAKIVLDLYSHPPAGGAVTRYPDFEIPYSGFGNTDSCKAQYDLPVGCTFASGCTEDSCTYSSISSGLGQKQVEPILGADGYPVYRNNANDPGPNNQHNILGNGTFWGWWHSPSPIATSPTLALVNTLTLTQDCNTGLFTYSNNYYFPLDNKGLASTTRPTNLRELQTVGDDGGNHNFGFTDSIHTQFVYKGDEVFEFNGDDDVWVFIDKQLVIDLGGLHQSICRRVDLSNPAQIIPTGGAVARSSAACPYTAFPNETVSLNLTVGQSYSLDFFHVERHSTGSGYKIATNMQLKTVCKAETCTAQYGPNSQCSCNGQCECKPGYMLDSNNKCNACDANACASQMGSNGGCDCSGNCACKPGWQTDQNGKCAVPRTTQQCSVWPDPHFRTFDGCQYNYHGECDYVMLSTSMGSAPRASNNNVEVQIRTKKQDPSWDWSTVSEVAFSFGPDKVNIDLTGISVNGQRLTGTKTGQALGPFAASGVTGSIVSLTPNPTYVFNIPRIDGIGTDTIKVFNHPSWGLWDGLTVEISAGNDLASKGDSLLWGSMGLCGLYDMNVGNDLTVPDQNGQSGVAPDVDTFAAAWAVPPAQNLLTGNHTTCNFATQCPTPPLVTGNSSCTGAVSYTDAVNLCVKTLTPPKTTTTTTTSTSSTGVNVTKIKSTTDFSNCLFDVCVGGHTEFANQSVYSPLKCPDDCNGGGDCVNGVCNCYPGFLPPNCERGSLCPTSFSCPTGLKIRPNENTTRCATMDCDVQDCCYVPTEAPVRRTVAPSRAPSLAPSTRTPSRAPTRTPTRRPTQRATTPAPPGGSCAGHQCAFPSATLPSADNVVCSNPTCTDQECCVAVDRLTCESFQQCGPGTRLISSVPPSQTLCTGETADATQDTVTSVCSADECCEPFVGGTCASHTCLFPLANRPSGPNVVCQNANCTDAECCVNITRLTCASLNTTMTTTTPTISPFFPTAPPTGCQFGMRLKTNPAPSTVMCHGETPDPVDDTVISTCSTFECCELPPSVPITPVQVPITPMCNQMSCVSCITTPSCYWQQPFGGSSIFTGSSFSNPFMSSGSCTSYCVPSPTQACYGQLTRTGTFCPTTSQLPIVVPTVQPPTYTPKLYCNYVPNYAPMVPGPNLPSYNPPVATPRIPIPTTTTTTTNSFTPVQIPRTYIIPSTQAIPQTTATTTGGYIYYPPVQQQQINYIPQATTTIQIYNPQPIIPSTPVNVPLTPISYPITPIARPVSTPITPVTIPSTVTAIPSTPIYSYTGITTASTLPIRTTSISTTPISTVNTMPITSIPMRTGTTSYPISTYPISTYPLISSTYPITSTISTLPASTSYTTGTTYIRPSAPITYATPIASTPISYTPITPIATPVFTPIQSTPIRAPIISQPLPPISFNTGTIYQQPSTATTYIPSRITTLPTTTTTTTNPGWTGGGGYILSGSSTGYTLNPSTTYSTPIISNPTYVAPTSAPISPYPNTIPQSQVSCYYM